MAFESFIDWEPQKDSTRACLSNAILLINHYGRQGYRMTLRQIYYQMVARDLMPNNRNSYQTLDRVLVLGRMAGWIDWDAIVDRVRRPVKPADWENGADRLRDAAADFRLDRWLGQPCYLEVWSEKDALTGVLEPICSDFHVTYMALRGYSSITAFYDGAKRIEGALEERGQQPTLLYLGDHDPSGVDMSPGPGQADAGTAAPDGGRGPLGGHCAPGPDPGAGGGVCAPAQSGQAAGYSLQEVRGGTRGGVLGAGRFGPAGAADAVDRGDYVAAGPGPLPGAGGGGRGAPGPDAGPGGRAGGPGHVGRYF